jgi:hypothetical protein
MYPVLLRPGPVAIRTLDTCAAPDAAVAAPALAVAGLAGVARHVYGWLA